MTNTLKTKNKLSQNIDLKRMLPNPKLIYNTKNVFSKYGMVKFHFKGQWKVEISWSISAPIFPQRDLQKNWIFFRGNRRRLNDQWEKNHQKKYEGPKQIFGIVCGENVCLHFLAENQSWLNVLVATEFNISTPPRQKSPIWEKRLIITTI